MPLTHKPTSKSRLNSRYVTLINIILFGNSTLTNAVFETGFNLYHLLVSKFLFSFRVNFVKRAVTSSLQHLISVIFPFCSQKQMIRTYTRRVVASVTNALRIVEGSISKIIASAMSQFSQILVSTEKASISLRVFKRLPNPASVALNNFIPEPSTHNTIITCVHGGVKFHY